jgi:secreted PhoX family phosphatase
MISRRGFLQTLAAVAAVPSQVTANTRARGFGKLQPDSSQIIDLPAGFEYRVIARMGEEMSDGLLVPGEADGMAAFSSKDGRVNIVCNHENSPAQQIRGPFGHELERIGRIPASCLYDDGGGVTPGTGGTTTIVYNPASGKSERQFMSLAGTELNCAGGATPWGSWLSCEETFSDPGRSLATAYTVKRSKRHGYVFEVPAQSAGCSEPRPLKDMGRFEHEAAAVDPISGAVYLTEDRHRSLLYRYLPNTPGKLHLGGRLQALAIVGQDQFDTRNWGSDTRMAVNDLLPVRWIDLEDVDADENDLRFRGYEQGAAQFARGEDLCFADGSVFITCTIGGPDRLGQVFEYRVSRFEGTDNENTERGQLRLIAESTPDSILRHADNIIMSPWGDLIVCEDTAGHCGLVGLRPDGSQYYLAANAYTDSELAGVCFSPDGKTMFLNIQVQGLTLAINGPWQNQDIL